MFSRSHRKRKKKRVLQPIDNPKERGRSLENNKISSSNNEIRSISVENSAGLKLKHETCRDSILDPYSQTILSTESTDCKLPPKPFKKPNKLLQIKPTEKNNLFIDKMSQSKSF